MAVPENIDMVALTRFLRRRCEHYKYAKCREHFTSEKLTPQQQQQQQEPKESTVREDSEESEEREERAAREKLERRRKRRERVERREIRKREKQVQCAERKLRLQLLQQDEESARQQRLQLDERIQATNRRWMQSWRLSAVRRITQTHSLYLRSPKILKTKYLNCWHLLEDYFTKRRIHKENLALMHSMNKLYRVRPFTLSYNQTFRSTSKVGTMNRRTMCLECDNYRLGMRLLNTKTRMDTRAGPLNYPALSRRRIRHVGVATPPPSRLAMGRWSWQLARPSGTPPPRRTHPEPTSSSCPPVREDTLRRYQEQLDGIDARLLCRLLRPKIYCDFACRSSPLGRIVVQLFTEACPELVLELVRQCVAPTGQGLSVPRIFPRLWMECDLEHENSELQLPLNNCKPVYARGPGICSFPDKYLCGFPPKRLWFAMSFRHIPLLTEQHVAFGIVASGLNLLECLETYGTKNGKKTDDVHITAYGVHH